MRHTETNLIFPCYLVLWSSSRFQCVNACLREVWLPGETASMQPWSLRNDIWGAHCVSITLPERVGYAVAFYQNKLGKTDAKPACNAPPHVLSRRKEFWWISKMI